MEVRLGGREEAAGIFEPRHVERWKEADSLGFWGRNKAHLAFWHEAAGAARDQICAAAQTAQRDFGAQRQYSKIYGRRVSRLGISPVGRRMSGADDYRTRKLDHRQSR